MEVIRSATLRDRAEIQEVCEKFFLIRFLLQEERIDAVNKAILRRVNLQLLVEVGVFPTEDAIFRAHQTIIRMAPDERGRAAGLYFVRYHAAIWYLSNRPTYF